MTLHDATGFQSRRRNDPSTKDRQLFTLRKWFVTSCARCLIYLVIQVCTVSKWNLESYAPRSSMTNWVVTKPVKAFHHSAGTCFGWGEAPWTLGKPPLLEPIACHYLKQFSSQNLMQPKVSITMQDVSIKQPRQSQRVLQVTRLFL